MDKLKQYELLLDNVTDYALIVLDHAGDIITWSTGAEHIFGYAASEVLGKPASIIFTDDDKLGGVAERELATAEREGRAADVRWHLRKDGSRFWAVGSMERLGGSPGTTEGFVKIVRDATDERQAVEDERTRLVGIFMRSPAFVAVLRGPHHIFEIANLLYYRVIGKEDEFPYQGIIGKSVEEVLPGIAEQGFITLLDQVYRTGKSYLGSETRLFVPAGEGTTREIYVDFSYQALRDNDGTITGILVHGVDLTERKRLEQEREQLLAATRIQVEHESILNQIGTAVRSAVQPEAIQEAAIRLLGEGINVDRCYFSRYDVARDSGALSPEWLRPGGTVKSLAGDMSAVASFSINTNALFQAGKTQVIGDAVAELSASESAVLADLDIRSFIRVPFAVGKSVQVLGVNMATTPRAWTADEVRLVENVAVLVQSAMENAFMQQREHNIALQLQEALLPEIKSNPAAIRVASYYRPALAEAGVGGDFFDVFPLRDGCTAFVVADLSGKGLAAAKEVALVRNMLRLALYSAETTSEAVTVLHRAIVAHDLLTSFCTLFVGVHDQNDGSLSYVNCGQEPGLIYRAATGDVEEMPPTGPVLGVLGTGPYQERFVQFGAGDVFALFTDGLTEVGPTRKTMLEIEGVRRIFRECCAGAGFPPPETVVNCLINGVGTAAAAGARDDIALLVGVIQSAGKTG